MTFSYLIILGPSQINALPEAPSPPSDTKSAQNNIWHLFLPLRFRRLLERARISSTFTLSPMLGAEGMNVQILGFQLYLGLGFFWSGTRWYLCTQRHPNMFIFVRL